MKKAVQPLVVCGFILAFAATSAFGSFVVSLDENGNGSITGLPAGDTPIPATFEVDPVSGLTGLFYDLSGIAAATGFDFTSGDVVLALPELSLPSDVIRFNDVGGRQGVFFFSLLDHIPDGLADVVNLPVPDGPIVLTEIGPEGNNGAQWQPVNVGDPGFVPQAAGLFVYNFVSDAPEPSTIVLAGLAAAGLAISWFRRRRD